MSKTYKDRYLFHLQRQYAAEGTINEDYKLVFPAPGNDTVSIIYIFDNRLKQNVAELLIENPDDIQMEQIESLIDSYEKNLSLDERVKQRWFNKVEEVTVK